MGGELLREYLATNDAACPACGYNLHGMRGDNCPECGRPLELAIREVGFGPRRRLLLLIFGVLLVVGAARSIQAANAIHAIGYAQPQTVITYSFTAPAPGSQGGGTIAQAPRARLIGPQNVNPAWDASRVGAAQWIAAAWWVLLGMSSLGAFASILGARNQVVSRRRQSAFTAVAWIGGAGMGLALFVEMLGSL